MFKGQKLLFFVFFVVLILNGVLVGLYLVKRPSFPTGREPVVEVSPDVETTQGAKEFLRFMNTSGYEKEGISAVWQNWDWQETMIFADIVSVASESGGLEININLPDNQLFSGRNKTVEVQCTSDQTERFYYKDLLYLGGNVNIFKYAHAGDHFYAYCLDADCNSLGRACIIIER
ncbi:MAG: hypothetical protein KKH28_05330 [Elusimicrobia bacterium]|nr:hypothetical protein [Elusimicrobiota bacterium]